MLTKKHLHLICLIATICIGCMSICGEIFPHSRIGDLLSHWQWQYFWTLVGLVFCTAFLRWRKSFLTAVMMLCIPAYQIFVTIPPPLPAVNTDIYFVNAEWTNTDLSTYFTDITTLRPPIVAVVEMQHAFRDFLVGNGYIAVTDHDATYDSQGVFVRADMIDQIGETEVIFIGKYPVSLVRWGEIQIILIHPWPGYLSSAIFDRQVRFFTEIHTLISGYEQNKQTFVLVGDFNSTVFSPLFQRNFGHLITPRLATWEAGKIQQLGIDHAIGNTEIRISVQSRAGSDHSALLIDLPLY